MKKLAITLSAMLLIIFNAIGQDAETDENTTKINSNRKYKNEIAIDISPFKFILGDFGAGYPSIFFRRHFSENRAVKGLNGVNVTTFHAYRFRIGSNLSFQKVKSADIKSAPFYGGNVYNYTYQLTDNSSFFIRVGKEKQIRFNRFELFYGFDLFFNYDKSSQYYIYSNSYGFGSPNQNFLNERTVYSFSKLSAGVAGIGGFKYFLIPRLCFSAEATINLGYSRQSNENSFERYDSSSGEYTKHTTPFDISGVKLGINPLFVVNIGYYF